MVSAWFVICCLAGVCSFITLCLFITVLPQSYLYNLLLWHVYHGFCCCAELYTLPHFFFPSLALSTFWPSWSKLHSWDSPFLLSLKALFPVMFVDIDRKTSACGSCLNYCFFSFGLTIPWQLNAQQVYFNLPLQSPDLHSLGHNLLCSSVFLVNPLFILC